MSDHLQLALAWLAGCIFVLICSSAFAMTPQEKANHGTVTLVAGELGGSSLRIAADLAAVLNEGDTLRILPTMGQGSLKNLYDLLYLKGVDLAIVQADVLAFVKQHKRHRDIPRWAHYITKLYREELHILAGRDIETIQDLAGKKVNVVSEFGGDYITANAVFEAHQISIQPVFYDTALGIEKVRRGDIAATVLVTGKPAMSFAHLTPQDELHLVSVSMPSGMSADEPSTFSRAELTKADYPNLVWPNDTVATLAVDAVLMVHNFKANSWRYNKVARFVDAFLEQFDAFRQAPRDKKWREVDLTAEVSGWTRFKPADDWLQRNAAASKTAGPSLKQAFQAFLDEQSQLSERTALTDGQKDELFERFLEWQKQRLKNR